MAEVRLMGPVAGFGSLGLRCRPRSAYPRGPFRRPPRLTASMPSSALPARQISRERMPMELVAYR